MPTRLLGLFVGINPGPNDGYIWSHNVILKPSQRPTMVCRKVRTKKLIGFTSWGRIPQPQFGLLTVINHLDPSGNHGNQWRYPSMAALCYNEVPLCEMPPQKRHSHLNHRMTSDILGCSTFKTQLPVVSHRPLVAPGAYEEVHIGRQHGGLAIAIAFQAKAKHAGSCLGVRVASA